MAQHGGNSSAGGAGGAGSGQSGGGFGEQVSHAAQRVMDNETVRNAQERIQTQGREAVRLIQERVQAQGPELVDRVKALAAEANVRRISIQQDGKTVIEFPLAAGAVAGVVGVLVMPQLVALGAIAALFTNVTITVEREENSPPGGQAGAGTTDTTPSTTGGSASRTS